MQTMKTIRQTLKGITLKQPAEFIGGFATLALLGLNGLDSTGELTITELAPASSIDQWDEAFITYKGSKYKVGTIRKEEDNYLLRVRIEKIGKRVQYA